MQETKRFLDADGVKTLYSELSLNDYPNNETLVAIINAIDENKANKDEIPHSYSRFITLYASKWDANQNQTISVKGLLGEEELQLLTPSPIIDSIKTYYDAGILLTNETDESVTFSALVVPTEDIKLFLTITPIEENKYLSFYAPSEFSISVATPSWDGTIEYSNDTKNWNVWDGSAVSGTELYFRGSNNTKVAGGAANKWAITGSNVDCIGNIEMLLNHSNPSEIEMAQGCYKYMFYGCSALVSAPRLPALSLSKQCYQNMFQGCSNLIKTPRLPATTLDSSCYNYMFSNCPKLTALPKLPATNLPSYCYQNMFSSCTNIKLSNMQSEEYPTPFAIPSSGTGTAGTGALSNMFTSTGGTFADTPEMNVTYYLHSSNSVR